MTRKKNTIITAITSVPTIDAQIPLIPQTKGNSKTAITSKTTVRMNEMMAETRPLFRAVKKAEPNMA